MPVFHEVTSKEDVIKLYKTDELNRNMYIMYTAGPKGLRDRSKIILPQSEEKLKLQDHIISEQKPWVLVQNRHGQHYLTCTAIRNSQVIANVTCKIDTNNNTLISVENKQIDKWITDFFNKIQLFRPVSGHFSFRFVICEDTVIPVSSQVGVSLAYTCFTSMHPKLLWKHCRHSRQNSRLIFENGHIKVKSSAVVNNFKLLSKNSFKSGVILDKRNSMFKLSDPLPYISYYYMHLPFKNLLHFVERKEPVLT